VKKVSLILIVSIIISIALAGCAPKTTNNTTSKVQTDQNTGIPQAKNKSDTSNASGFNLVTTTYVNKNAKINYPQITGFSDYNKQKQINSLIKNDILNNYKNHVTTIAKAYYNNDYQKAEGALTEKVNYYTKLNSSKLLSILYVENGSIPGSMHPDNMVHSININIKNGTILKFKDLINIDNNFVEKFRNVKDSIWMPHLLPGMPAEAQINLGTTINFQMSMLQNKDLIDQLNSDDYSFYFTKYNFGMTTYVDHASGDYAELEIKYNNIKDNINPKNRIWKYFINTRNNVKNIKGFKPIENQSFVVDLNSWGSVKFVSGKLTAGNVVFYLTNKNGDILYDFDETLPSNVDVKAVSFVDVNKDGLKDIIIISAGNDSSKQAAAVYLQKDDGSFTDDPKLDQEINASGNNKDIKTVTNYLYQKF
jgi:hypothetical protein